MSSDFEGEVLTHLPALHRAGSGPAPAAWQLRAGRDGERIRAL
jgi:hypothetical protein